MVFGAQLRMMMLFNLGWPRLAASSPRAPQEGYAVTRPRIGLALGSGSARGWAHIGVIDSLIEAGIEPDVVCGTSIGALVGAAYVAGKLDGLRSGGIGAAVDARRGRPSGGSISVSRSVLGASPVDEAEREM